MGNIAYRTGEKIFWDIEKNKFSHKDASKLVKPDYENGWKLPKLSWVFYKLSCIATIKLLLQSVICYYLFFWWKDK